MLDSNPNEPTSSEKMPPRENEENDDVKKDEEDADELNSRTSRTRENIDRPVGRDLTISEDQDAETVALSRLRCTSIRTEEIADREKQKKISREQRRNRCADYPGLAFGSAAFGSETMMKFNIIKNELHNIMRSQLKRVDGEVAALSQRIKALDDNLAKSEEYIKTATAALADAVAMEVDRNETDLQDEENNNPLSQFDAQMAILEGRLLQAKYLASKASSQTIINSEDNSNLTSSVNNIATTTPTVPTVTVAEKPPPKLRRPFPVP